MVKQTNTEQIILSSGFIEKFNHTSVYLSEDKTYLSLGIHRVVSIQESVQHNIRKDGSQYDCKIIELKLENGKTVCLNLFGNKGLFPAKVSNKQEAKNRMNWDKRYMDDSVVRHKAVRKAIQPFKDAVK